MSSSPSYNYLDLPYNNDFLLSIFFVPRKKKYTAYLINKDGSFNTDNYTSGKIAEDQNILCIKNNNSNNL